jgi:PAS domain S-box-containing protein
VTPTERRLEAERRRFERLTEYSTDVIVLVDGGLRFSYVSASVETILGHDPGDLIGDDSLSYVHPEDRHVAADRLGRWSGTRRCRSTTRSDCGTPTAPGPGSRRGRATGSRTPTSAGS